MGKLDTYNICLKKMPAGEHDVDFHLTNTFFEAIGEETLQKGDLQARVHISKKISQESTLTFVIEGSVVVLCDRCLEEMDQPIKADGRLVVRMGKEFKDDGDEVVVIPEEMGVINVAWFLYEFIELAIPIKHVHPLGRCNTGMAAKLDEHLVRQAGFEEVYDEMEEERERLDEEEAVGHISSGSFE